LSQLFFFPDGFAFAIVSTSMDEESIVLSTPQQMSDTEPAGMHAEKAHHEHLGMADDNDIDDAMATRDQNIDDSNTTESLTDTADAGISALKARRAEIESKVQFVLWVHCSHWLTSLTHFHFA
jgi:hypothetical protein